MSVLAVVINAVAILCGVLALAFIVYYIPRMVGWFKVRKKQAKLFNPKLNKIAVIIPARNESAVIGVLLDSLKLQTYPKCRFDTHIIVKEARDKTIEIAKDYGAFVHIVPEQNCKGYAVDRCLKNCLAENPDKYDAYVIVDADCMLDNKFLEEMNNAMASDAQIIQAKKLVKNYLIEDKKANSIWSNCNGLIWTMIDELGNKHKTSIGATNMTIGTGIMFRSDVIKTLGGFPYQKTLTEDIELMYDCVIKNFSTYYYSYAKIYVEESPSHEMTKKRRIRWMTGVVDSTRLYAEQLKSLPKTKEVKRNIYYTTSLSKVYRYVGLLVGFTVLNAMGSILLGLMGYGEWLLALMYAGIGFATLYLSFFFLTLACFIADWKNIKISFWQKMLVLFYHPINYMEYIPIVYKALRNKQSQEWEVIERVTFTSKKTGE